MTEQRVVILGALVFSEEVADFASEIPGVRIEAFIENLNREHPPSVRGIPVLWVDELPRLAATHLAVCALGTTRRRTYVEQARDMGVGFATLIHPTARVSKSTEIGPGCIVSPAAMIAAHSRIGSHTIVNRGALIGHHLEMGEFVTVGPGVNIGGVSQIGDQVFLGIGATVIDRVRIGRGSLIAAGAVVTKDVPPHSLAAGVPARILRSGIEPK